LYTRQKEAKEKMDDPENKIQSSEIPYARLKFAALKFAAFCVTRL
jgi:hypothetical protein